jgi:hypothetical protein
VLRSIALNLMLGQTTTLRAMGARALRKETDHPEGTRARSSHGQNALGMYQK